MLTQISKATALDKWPFFCTIKNQKRIDSLPIEIQSIGMGVVFTNQAILTGYKGKIPDLNKQDIALMIRTKYRTLSLEEICYAFQLDRHGHHGEPTKHYQLFNAEYVTTILSKYLAWKNEMKRIEKRV